MCKLLNIPRATLYYAKNHDLVKSKNEDTKLVNIPRATLYYAKNHDLVKSKNEDTKLVKTIQKIFKKS